MTSDAEDAVCTLLRHLRLDINDPGLLDTPRRVVKALQELTSGYTEDPAQILSTVFDDSYDEMVVVTGIPFSSLCEHHLLPFHGEATVGYIPDGRVVGLSKIPRLVNAFAKRVQIQERLTSQITQALMDHLKPLGAGCVITAHHTCMSMRGIKSQGNMTTSSLLGLFRDKAQAEFLGFHRHGK